jgi:hypothetical protein
MIVVSDTTPLNYGKTPQALFEWTQNSYAVCIEPSPMTMT